MRPKKKHGQNIKICYNLLEIKYTTIIDVTDYELKFKKKICNIYKKICIISNTKLKFEITKYLLSFQKLNHQKNIICIV